MATYRGRTVKLNKPMQGDVKKFKVYVKDKRTGNVKKINFGQKGMTIGRNDPARRRSFNARMGAVLAKVKGQKTLSAAYWSLQAWKPDFKLQESKVAYMKKKEKKRKGGKRGGKRK